MRPLLLAALLAALALAPALAGAQAQREATVRSAIFYYPWYGTPALDGSYQHWQQNRALPPRRISSAYFPARGVYSSSDRPLVAEQMREIASTGVDQVVVSWWGRGSAEDRRLRMTAAAARAAGLAVAAHVEPYGGRDPASVERDITYLRGYGIKDVYLYGPEDRPPEEWAALNDRLQAPVRVFAQTGHVGFAAAGRFAGVYTYDILIWNGSRLGRICAHAHAAD